LWNSSLCSSHPADLLFRIILWKNCLQSKPKSRIIKHDANELWQKKVPDCLIFPLCFALGKNQCHDYANNRRAFLFSSACYMLSGHRARMQDFAAPGRT